MDSEAADELTDAQLSGILNAATNAQVGALGEETARFYLEDVIGADIVTLGDAGMPRSNNRQDLDITAIVDGRLLAFEVKARYFSQRAGRFTRGGDLLRPRLGRTHSGSRQGSQTYTAERLTDIVDTGDGYEGVTVELIVVDFRLMLLQFFNLDDIGRILAAIAPPASCAEAVRTGYREIVGHRGHL